MDDSDGGSARATTIINIFLPLYMIFGQFVCSSAAIRIFYHISLHASDFRTNGTLCVNHTTQPFIESSKKKSWSEMNILILWIFAPIRQNKNSYECQSILKVVSGNECFNGCDFHIGIYNANCEWVKDTYISWMNLYFSSCMNCTCSSTLLDNTNTIKMLFKFWKRGKFIHWYVSSLIHIHAMFNNEGEVKKSGSKF